MNTLPTYTASTNVMFTTCSNKRLREIIQYLVDELALTPTHSLLYQDVSSELYAAQREMRTRITLGEMPAEAK